jgi:hypothetical protein
MSSIRYSQVPEAIDKSLAWPFITSAEIAEILHNSRGNLKDDVLLKSPEFQIVDGKPVWDKETGNIAPLFYLGTGYNWISSFTTAPPSEDGDGNPVTTSKLNVIWFKNELLRDMAFTLFVSKWMFAWWSIYGDDFDVTKDNLLSFPVDLHAIPELQQKRLTSLSKELNDEMVKRVKWQKVTFPDKRVIKVGNWDLGACKAILKDIDAVWTEILGASKSQPELQFQYFSTVKTSSEDFLEVVED